ncbi:MAG TPA: VWA domain-containing protein [Kofleriaceae bacterium]|nr:VWA domain-containing protein [Kofleriaceae bacterium]
MRIPLSFAFVLSAACMGSSGGASDSAGAPLPGTSPPSSPGGGGVSFGGAQDIGELRSILDRGEIPGPDTFDANGFFNEHFNAPAPATCGNLLCVASGLSVGHDWLTGAHQATLQLAIESTVDPTTYHRLPMNLVVVVDHSGSMASDGRLDKVKGGLHTMIDHLLDEDRLAIVEFDDQVNVDATFGATLDRTKLHAIVDKLTPRGATDIFDGLQQGFQLLGDVPASDHQNRVIFLSDGLATAGDTSQDHIMQMAKERVQRGIGLTTIGVGNEFDVALMRGLAEQGAGNFYFLEDATAAIEVFTEELDFFMQPIALDVRLDATAGPGYQFGEVVGSRLWAAEAGYGSIQIPAVFVASRTSQSGGTGRRGGGSMIFIHMTPVSGNTGRVADLTLSFRAPGSEVRTEQVVSLDYANDPTVTPEQPYLSSPEMAERFAMYNMFLGIRAATQASDLGCARSVLEATRTAGKTWNATHEDPDLQADLTLVDQYLGNIDEKIATGYDGTAHPISSCPTAIGPDEPPYVDPQPVDGYNGDQPRYHSMACSTGTATGGLPIMLAAVLAAAGLGRRRRRYPGTR